MTAVAPILLALTASPSPAVASIPPRIEVAFVLDTTGSMGGLIEGAKRRIWSIARRIGEARPRPGLRIALVGYRDRGDQYVTLVHDFTGDMDLVYERLMAFRAEGGGDTPEHVSAALAQAVHGVAWSREHALRVIFLVGDAPPHLDYQDGYDYRRHAREAGRRGIGVETIQCGGDPSTAAVWREIARLGGGDYARIDAQGGMPAHVTPADAELARLHRELATTVVAGGTPAERAATGRRLAARASMPEAVAAEAASFYAGAGRLAAKDLVDMPVAEQKKELDALRRDAGAAPAAVRGKSEEEAIAYLEEQRDRRQKLQARIAELQRQRDACLAKAGVGQEDGFDQRVIESLRKRAAEAGVRF